MDKLDDVLYNLTVVINLVSELKELQEDFPVPLKCFKELASLKLEEAKHIIQGL